MTTKLADHILIRDPLLRWVFVTALAVSFAIFYWLIYLRQRALDISFESIFNGLFLFYDYPLIIAQIVLLVLALLPWIRSGAFRCVEFIGSHVGVVAVVYLIVLACGSLLVYRMHPLSMDEYAPVFQSKIFAAGELTGKFPVQLVDWLVPGGFQGNFFKVSPIDGRVASAYWPGFALLLTPFTVLGIPWMCNPVVGAASVLMIHRLALKLFGKPSAAGLAVLLAVAAPAFTIDAISFYSMSAHLLFNGCFTLLLLELTPRRAFAAGMLGSLALCLHNPLPHMLFAAPWLIWLMVDRQRRRILPALVAGYVPLIIVLGIGWWLLLQGLVRNPDSTAVISVGQAATVFTMPSLGLLYARLVGLAKLWIWAVPAVIPLAVAGYMRCRDNTYVRLLAWSAALTFLGYLFVPFDQGHGWGFRYFHSVWFVIPLFAAATFAVGDTATNSADDKYWGATGYSAACAVLSLVLLLPLSALGVQRFISLHLAQSPVARVPSVVILRPGSGYYAVDLVQNDPFLRDPVVRLQTRGRQLDQQMMSQNFSGYIAIESDAKGSVWVPRATAPDSSIAGEAAAIKNHIEKKGTE